MRHLLICREYPPSAYPQGGIGTYAQNIARLLAERGETVHVIAQRWRGADTAREETHSGRLNVHRVAIEPDRGEVQLQSRVARALFGSALPPQAFSWHAALLAERIVIEHGIDIIEAQEWEAPLYYFQLRRALGLGPSSQPPCIIHLHSPTEYIVRYNDWIPDRPDFQMAQRLENYSIAAADAWLCPSAFLARDAESRYSLSAGSVHVIPLPRGGTAVTPRSRETWTGGPVLYVGRMEPRKGVLEWVAAAARVAARHDDVTFEFVGTDLPYSEAESVRVVAMRSIPRSLWPRFRFRGEQPRTAMSQFFAMARIAVVPSRWENFPNTCVEAMASGLPVIATRRGGMAEMITDGQSGWLCDDAEPGQLADALERALLESPERLSAMGADAARTIGEICDDATVLESHLRFRSAVIRSAAAVQDESPSVGVPSSTGPAAGALVLVNLPPGGRYNVDVLEALAGQSRQPAMIVTAGRWGTEAPTFPAGVRAVQVDRQDEGRWFASALAGAQGARPFAVIVIDGHVVPGPRLVEACMGAMERCDDLGIITVWGAGEDPGAIGPPPAFPFQLIENGAAGAVAIRGDAFRQSGAPPDDMPSRYGIWALVNSVMANGWRTLAYPEVLATRVAPSEPHMPDHWRWWPRVLERTPHELTRHAGSLALLLESRRHRERLGIAVVPPEHTSSLHAFLSLSRTHRAALLREMLNHPVRSLIGALQRLARHVMR